MKNCRGSHVGMMLSFVIFITFLIFLYVVVNPSINTGTDKGNVLDHIENEIIKNVSSNFTSTSFEISSEVTIEEDCVIIQGFFGLVVNDGIPSARVFIKNETGGIQEAYTEVGALGPKINRIDWNNLFFRVYYSPEFEELGAEDILTCDIISDSDYNIGLIRAGKYIFEENVIDLINYYNDNYGLLKTELNVPPNNEFGFEFVDNSGTKTTAEQETTSGEVYAEEIPIQYIDENANIQTGFINIKVW